MSGSGRYKYTEMGFRENPYISPIIELYDIVVLIDDASIFKTKGYPFYVIVDLIYKSNDFNGFNDDSSQLIILDEIEVLEGVKIMDLRDFNRIRKGELHPDVILMNYDEFVWKVDSDIISYVRKHHKFQDNIYITENPLYLGRFDHLEEDMCSNIDVDTVSIY